MAELKPPTATIMPGHPRYEDFRQVFLDHEPDKTETISVPIKSLVADIGSAPGVDSAEFYRIDVTRMRPDQVSRMARFIALRFGGKVEVIEKMILKDGFVPLKNEHLCVAIDMRFLI